MKKTALVRRQRAAGLCGVPGCPTESKFYFCLSHRLFFQEQRRARQEGLNTDPVHIPDDPTGRGDDDRMDVVRM